MSNTLQKSYGAIYKRLYALNILGIPYGDTLPTITGEYGPGALFYNTTNEGLYISNGSVWNLQIGGGGAGNNYLITDILYGDATWSGTGLVMDLTDASYLILGTSHLGSATTVTHDPADATFPRIDVIYWDSGGQAGIITGVPSASPVKPQVDPTSQVELSFVLIEAGATTPTQITNTIIYDEGTESTEASDVAGADFAWATNPFNGIVSTKIGAFTNAQYLSYLMAAPLDTTDYNYLKFYIRLGATFASGTFLSLYLYSGTTLISNSVNIAHASYGFSRTTINTWQLITIPMSAFSALSQNAFDKIHIRLNGSNATGFQLDYLYFQSGNSGGGAAGVFSFNGRTGVVLPAAGDYPPAFIGAEASANKGQVGGYASLDGSGKVPAAQLPSYVDDVVEAADFASLPGTGETSKIYVTLDDNATYRWSGSAYIQLSDVIAAATELIAGIIEIATQAEVTAGTDDTRAITPLKLITHLASLPGGAVKATSAELNTGTDDAKFATALALENSKYVNRDDTKNYATATGTDTYVLALTPALTAYAAGQRFNVKFTNANTGAATINIDGLGAKSIVKDGAGTALAAADITAGRIVTIVYDGTNFQTIGAAAAGGGGGGTWGSITGTVASQADIQDATLQGSYTAGAGTVVLGDTLKAAIQKLDGNITLVGATIAPALVGNRIYLSLNCK